MNYEEMKMALLQANDSYYNKSFSTMSDAGYDNLKDQFTKLYPNDVFLKTIGAPIPETSEWEKSKHNIPMTSCNKVNTTDEFVKWAKDNRLDVEELMTSEKLDGISLSIDYKDGKMVKATTRGDGFIGENIMSNVLRMQNVKEILPIPFTGSLRGEILMRLEDFKSVNLICEQRGERLYQNVRNGASGISKGYDGKYTEYLYVEYYNAIYADVDYFSAVGDFQTKQEVYDCIEKDLGLKTCKHFLGNLEKAKSVYNEYEQDVRASLNHAIDGLVIEPNNISKLISLGMLSENYRGMIAWKFEAMTAETTLIDIEWNVGNQQILTPVVIFETVRLGVNVSRASLCNVDMFIEMNLAKGDKILVSRRNDVIPKAESVIKKSGNKPFEYPKICPVCNEPTTIKGKFLYCLNDDCDSNIIGSLNKFIDKTGMLGISESTLTKLYESGLVKTPADLYRICVNDVLSLEGFAKKSAQKVIDIINSHKEMSLAVFIGALNIPQFSESMTKLLVESGYDTLEKLMKISKSELVSIKGIEEKKASSFLNGMYKKKELVTNLLQVGVKIIEKRSTVMKSSGSKLSGKSFVFTGTIERIDPETGKHYTRDKLQEFVVMNGGTTPSSLSKETTYLVQADPSSQSTKTQKAEKFGVEIISEVEFFKMIGK